ncbi:DAO-domain-containing protein [Xylaria acuta]|nr:DAO-domain-containing protein [Xylaria acuta]
MSTAETLFQQYQGHLVPRSFNPGFVVLSFIVSFIGAVSTLELLNRRTSHNGFINHVFLVSAAVTMGGIAIWSMHFVGNRAIILGQDQPELRIVYSTGFTAVSFFLPIIVLIAAFVATGANNHVSFWRIIGGGTLAGGAICAMHYIGNFSIANYSCQYQVTNVVGSAVIAVVASNVALSMFFLWRASWTNSWWRRGLSGILLASAVSGMHWCASTGTDYRLLGSSSSSQFSRNTIVVIVTVLSFSAALIVVGAATYGSWVTRSKASKARHVVLAAAVFDRAGRILVSPDGLLPSEKITDTYIEKTPSDTFSIGNPLFQWMFQASRNWNDINGMITSMTDHLAHMSGNGRGRSIRLIGENGQLIEHHDVIFRELFCLAAATLATKLKEQLLNVGVLWDGILPTGKARQYYPKEDPDDASERGESTSIKGSASGWGSLMFLVRRLEHPSDVEKLEAAGFRFADIRQVSGIIRSSMQIKTPDLDRALANMATYVEQSTMMHSVVHLGFFGIRPSVDGHGFDVLVEKGARNLLPASKLPLKRLEPWHTDFLLQYGGFGILSLQRTLTDTSARRLLREAEFATSLADAISTLRTRIDDRVFDEATLSCRTVQVPCRPRLDSNAVEECTMIVLHFVIPIHYSLHGSGCEFIPLSFFKIHQMAYKDSPYRAAFTQHLHREFVPALKLLPSTIHKPSHQQVAWGWRRGWRSRVRRLAHSLHGRRRSAFWPVDGEGSPIGKLSRRTSNQTGSSLELWGREESDTKYISNDSLPDRPIGTGQRWWSGSSLGGILVSQEVKVAISRAEESNSQSLQISRQSQDKGVQRPRRVFTTSPKTSGHTRMKSDKGHRIELKSLPKANTDRHVGQALGTTAAASGSASEMITFVDELFSTSPSKFGGHLGLVWSETALRTPDKASHCTKPIADPPWSLPPCSEPQPVSGCSRRAFADSMTRFARGTRLLRRLALPTSVAAVGGGLLLYSYRPRNIPGFEGPAVPPPIYGPDGNFKLPRFPKVKSREEQLKQLKKSREQEEEYDILVIGGGATGAGVALDAVTRGLKVAMVERDDFSSGTSSKSTKLVHGGVRYLEKAVWNLDYAQYQLVREALKERKYFLQTAPHLSMWLPIMLPLDKWWKAPYYWAGTKFYDFLAGSEGIESSYFLTRSKALDAFPMLKPTDLVGALVYYDGAHNDSRMNVSLAMTAALYGATVVNHAEVTGLMKNEQGKLCGATIKDRIPERDGRSSQDITVRAKCIVNCTGPFTDSIRKLDDRKCKEIVAPASGVHVILPGYYSPANMGLIDPSTSDGRVIFFLPWQGNTIAGTTDEPATITQNPLPDEKSIQWILNEISHYLAPEIQVRRGDVLAAWSGLRPLVMDPKATNTESLVRNHLIDVSESGLVTCAGGKWTTYRQMAEECVDAAVKEFKLPTKPVLNAPRVSGTEAVDDGAILDGSCQTHNVRLIGAHGFSKTLFINLIQHFGVETEVAKHLTESYGDRAWTVAAMCKPTDLRFPARGERISRLYPFVDGEIRYAISHEYAQTAVDILARRTRLAFLNAQAALECLPHIIDIMSQELKWDRTRQEREWKETVKFLESMGLPQPMLSATRADVEKGKLDFSSSLEYKMYSRHDKPLLEE